MATIVKDIVLAKSTDYMSPLLLTGRGRAVVDVDFYNDDGTEALGATGFIVFKAKTTDAPSSVASLNNGTVNVSIRDYDRPWASGPIKNIFADLSNVSNADMVRVSIWRE